MNSDRKNKITKTNNKKSVNTPRGIFKQTRAKNRTRKKKKKKPRDIWDISKDEEYIHGLNTIQYRLKCDVTKKKKTRLKKGETELHVARIRILLIINRNSRSIQLV